MYAFVCVLVCVHMCVYVSVWLRICVFCGLCGLSQNIEFQGHAIPGAVGVSCGAIPDDNAYANQRYFVHLHIGVGLLYS